MSIAMFIVGGCIFSVYVYFLIWNIFYNSKKNREENYPGYYARHGQTDSMRRSTGYPHDKVSRIKNKALRQQEMYLSKTKEK
tara:strand:- start:182 stop:427 length:246 start_codon:yes stop_codon:yes gene_type:complete